MFHLLHRFIETLVYRVNLPALFTVNLVMSLDVAHELKLIP
jgi:hypothetical protein